MDIVKIQVKYFIIIKKAILLTGPLSNTPEIIELRLELFFVVSDILSRN